MRWINAIRTAETRPIAVARSPCAGPGTPGAAFVALRIEQAGAGEVGGGVEARPVAVGAGLAITGQRGVDQPRVDRLHVVVTELSLSRTGGGKLQISTSDTAISLSSAARACGCLRSSTRERLLRNPSARDS